MKKLILVCLLLSGCAHKPCQVHNWPTTVTGEVSGGPMLLLPNQPCPANTKQLFDWQDSQGTKWRACQGAQ